MPIPIAYSATFTPNVIAGLLITLFAAVLVLGVTICWSWAEDRTYGGPPPASIRKLSVIAFTLFAIGIFWQLIGYLRMEWAGW
jgi:hypothetical protein